MRSHLKARTRLVLTGTAVVAAIGLLAGCTGGGADTCSGSGAEFIGDSHDVVIASYDGVLYRWDTDLDRALDLACQMAGRDLTEQEWAQVMPAQPYRSVCPQE